MVIRDVTLTSCYETGLLELRTWALQHMENSSLDIPGLAVFWKGSELFQKTMKTTLLDKVKLYNISANHTVELTRHFLRFLKHWSNMLFLSHYPVARHVRQPGSCYEESIEPAINRKHAL